MSTDHHEHKHPHDHEATTVRAPPPEADTSEVFRVTGMDCSEEVAAIEHALKPLEGVLGVRAEIVSSKVTVYHDGTLPRDRIAEAINRSGVTVSEDENEARRPVLRDSRRYLWLCDWNGACFAMVLHAANLAPGCHVFHRHRRGRLACSAKSIPLASHAHPRYETVFAGNVEDLDGWEWCKVGARGPPNKGRVFALGEA